jgi:hypothetical protein
MWTAKAGHAGDFGGITNIGSICGPGIAVPANMQMALPRNIKKAKTARPRAHLL